MLARLRCPPLSEPTRTSACGARPTASIASPTAASTSVALVDDGSRNRAAYRSMRRRGSSAWTMSSCGTYPSTPRNVAGFACTSMPS